MAFVKGTPESAAWTSNKRTLNELASTILRAVDVLTLQAPTKGLRFRRADHKTTIGSTEVLPFSATGLCQNGHASWTIGGLRTDESEGAEGYFNPDGPNPMYLLVMRLQKPNGERMEVVKLSKLTGKPDDEPLLEHEELYEGVDMGIDERGLDPSASFDDNSQVFYIRKIAEALQEEAAGVEKLAS